MAGMVSAAAAPPVSLGRCPGDLLRAPVRCRPLASRAMAPSPRREDSLKISQLQLRATRSSEESSSTEGNELLAGFWEKWDAIGNKSSVFLYGGGAIIAVWLSSIVARAIDSVPLIAISVCSSVMICSSQTYWSLWGSATQDGLCTGTCSSRKIEKNWPMRLIL